MAAILNSTILDSAILHKKTLLIHPDSTWWWQPFWILTMLDSDTTILDSAILHKTLTQTNSIWFKLIHSHSTWWCQPSWILLSSSQPFWTKKTSLIHSDSTWWWIHREFSYLGFSHLAQNSGFRLILVWLKLMNSHSTWWCQASCILPSWIQAFCTNKNFTHSFSLNLRMSAIFNSAFL